MTMTASPARPHLTRAQDTDFRPSAKSAIWRRGIALIIVLLSIPVGLVAIGSGTGLIALPFEMFVLAERMPVIFRLHMVTSAVALLLAPVVISVRHDRKVHRFFGRLLGGFVVAGGLTALPVAIFSSSTVAARVGFFAQGLVWMVLLAAGIHAIRLGRRATHARLMLAMVAVMTGAVWFRIMTGSAIALGLPFEPIYAASAWLGWIIPLTIVYLAPGLTQGLYAQHARPCPPGA